VARSDAWIAVWTYSLPRISPGIDRLINEEYYCNTLGPYWDRERRFVDEQYRSLPFPFREIPVPELAIGLQWTLDELQGYLQTWSALKKFIAEKKQDPLPDVIKHVAACWNGERMTVTFPLHLRMGQVLK